MNVLIIDDDPEDTEIFCEALGELIPSAICTVRNSCPDIEALIVSLPEQEFIFLDAHMALFSSKECFRDLIPIINKDRTKIVVYTGSVSPGEKAEFISFGVNEILIKTHSFFQLQTDLKKLLIDLHQTRN